MRGVLNLEMAATDEMLRIAREVKPDFCTLVPEKREERTTEGGLSVGPGGQVEKVARALAEAGIGVSLFIDPEPRVVEASARLGVGTVELHTGDYCLAPAARPGGGASSCSGWSWRRGRRPTPGCGWAQATGSTTRTSRRWWRCRGSRSSTSATVSSRGRCCWGCAPPSRSCGP